MTRETPALPRQVLVLIGSRQAATAATEAAVAAADPRARMTLLAVAAPPGVFARQYVEVRALQADIIGDVNSWLAIALDAIPPTVAVKALTVLDRPVRAVRRLVESADFDLVVWHRRPGLAGRGDARAAATLRRYGVPALSLPAG